MSRGASSDAPDAAAAPAPAARALFAVIAAGFALLGVTTARWISRANVGDLFYFGAHPMWSAMDPAGFYLPDVILFFAPGPVAHDYHPGLTMTAMAAVLAHLVYAGAALAGDPEPYVEFWVRHRMLLSGLLAGFADAMWLACCLPLFRVLRHVMDRSAAIVGCALFLAAVPVLLYLSRFSPEPWMLFFSLWSIHLSLRALDGDGGWRAAAAMGACTALAMLSRWLAAPLVALNLFSLLAAPRGIGAPRRAAFALYVLAGLVPAALLIGKLSLPHVVEGWALQAAAAPGIARSFALPHQRPLALHLALVFALGALGLTIMYARCPRSCRHLTVLLVTLACMALLVIRRPQWHYLFGVYWLFPAAAAFGLALLLRRLVPGRDDALAVVAGLIVLAVCNAWAYPAIVGTYARYADIFAQRAPLAARHPAWVAAPWELALSGYAETRDPARLVPVYGQRLSAILQQQRRHDDDANRVTP